MTPAPELPDDPRVEVLAEEVIAGWAGFGDAVRDGFRPGVRSLLSRLDRAVPGREPEPCVSCGSYRCHENPVCVNCEHDACHGTGRCQWFEQRPEYRPDGLTFREVNCSCEDYVPLTLQHLASVQRSARDEGWRDHYSSPASNTAAESPPELHYTGTQEMWCGGDLEEGDCSWGARPWFNRPYTVSVVDPKLPPCFDCGHDHANHHEHVHEDDGTRWNECAPGCRCEDWRPRDIHAHGIAIEAIDAKVGSAGRSLPVSVDRRRCGRPAPVRVDPARW